VRPLGSYVYHRVHHSLASGIEARVPQDLPLLVVLGHPQKAGSAPLLVDGHRHRMVEAGTTNPHAATPVVIGAGAAQRS